MNIRDLDLNLLLVFDAIYRERSISAAGKKLNLSQPTMSNALRRLREFTGDALFFRSANQMMPTRVAISLSVPISHALSTVEESLTAVRSFDPATSTRTFRLGGTDLFNMMLLPAMVSMAEKEAPNVKLKFLPQSADSAATLAAVRNGELDTAVLAANLVDDSVSSTIISNDRLVFVTRSGHPFAGKTVTRDMLRSARHVISYNTPGVRVVIEAALGESGISRAEAMVAPNSSSIPALLEVSDLVATMGHTFAKRHMRDHALTILDAQVTLPSIRGALLWPKAADEDQGHKWLRQRVEQILKTAFALDA